MANAFSILLAAAIMLHSLLGGIAAAGTICLGGGHEHPQDAATQGCELDCSHATQRMPLPALVGEQHDDCSCVDLELSIVELLTPLPRLDAEAPQDTWFMPVQEVTFVLADWSYRPGPPHVPKWFDPGAAQRIADLSTMRLIV